MWLRLTLTVGLILACLPVALAQDTCFCLRDAFDNWLRDCREVTVGFAPQPKIFCYDPQHKNRVEIPSVQGWERVLEGAEGCTPCLYQAPSPGEKEQIRGKGQSGQGKAPKENPDVSPTQ